MCPLYSQELSKWTILKPTLKHVSSVHLTEQRRKSLVRLGRISLDRFKDQDLLLHPILRFHRLEEHSLGQTNFLLHVKGQLIPFILCSIHCIHSAISHSTDNIGFDISESLAFDHARWYIIFILHTANNRILQYQVAKFRGLYLNEICRSATSCS